MRTIFTAEDTRFAIDSIFNGNLWKSKASNGATPYSNSNSELVSFVDEFGDPLGEKDLAEYLNIRFYSWKNRLVDKGVDGILPINAWIESLNNSMNEAYGLVEITNETSTASQDIDNAQIVGRITFIVQTNKVANLDYYVTKLRNKYLGLPIDYQNTFGDMLKCLVNIGILLYDGEPESMQLGECMTVSLNFSISYLADALTYADQKVSISLDGGLNYHEMPLIQSTWQAIFTPSVVPRATRPDISGSINSACSTVISLSYYDWNNELAVELNHIFWSRCAIKIDDTAVTAAKNVNIPVHIKVQTPQHTYIYKDVITQMEKVIKNGEFNICSIGLRDFGKLE